MINGIPANVIIPYTPANILRPIHESFVKAAYLLRLSTLVWNDVWLRRKYFEYLHR